MVSSINFYKIKFILFLMFMAFSAFALDLQNMTLEEKVGQLLMAHFYGEEANDEAKRLIQETKIGGIIYYKWSNGLHSPKQIRTLSTSLQQLTTSNPMPIPLLIAVDQEGGVVAHLHHGFTQFPGNRALGQISDPCLAKEAAFMMGTELQAVGINMNLAPVVDINSNPRNPVIGVRSFGEDSALVLAFAEQALIGYKQAKIIATLKHFPGHGDTAVDTHENLAFIYKSKEELEKVELLPFAQLAPIADVIMTAHLLVPALDQENCSTLSQATLNYLKNILGFQGVILSDSLVMEGVLKQCKTPEEAAIRALNAGCDLLILGGKLLSGESAGFELNASDIQHIHHSIVQAVQNGRISTIRIDQAAKKILDLKKHYLIEDVISKAQTDPTNTLFPPSHQQLAQKIADLSLNMIEHEKMSFLSQKHIYVCAPHVLKNALEASCLLKIGKSSHAHFFDHLSPSAQERQEAAHLAKQADLLLICSYNAWKTPAQEAFIQSLLNMGKPAVIVAARDPLDASLFPKAAVIFQTFSPSQASFQAVYQSLIDK